MLGLHTCDNEFYALDCFNLTCYALANNVCHFTDMMTLLIIIVANCLYIYLQLWFFTKKSELCAPLVAV